MKDSEFNQIIRDPEYALIVDDDPLFRKALGFILTKFAIESEIVSDASTFIHRLSQCKPSFLIIDLSLSGGESGFDLITHVRNQFSKTIPILVLSGTGATKTIAHALELGADDYIQKNIDLSYLASKLSRYSKSENLRERQALFVVPPGGKSEARLQVENRICSVDELGITLYGAHLFPKGTVLKLGGEFLASCFGLGVSVIATVVSTSLDKDGMYTSYVEFDETNPQVLQAVRKWIQNEK